MVKPPASFYVYENAIASTDSRQEKVAILKAAYSDNGIRLDQFTKLLNTVWPQEELCEALKT